MRKFLLGAVAVVAWIGIGLSTVFWTLLILAVFVVHPLADPQRKILHRLASCWGRVLLWMAPGCKVELTGRESIPVGRPVILMANHQSYVDVPGLFFLPGQFKWMADEGLFRIPVFGWALRMAGYIPVRRGDAREGVRSLLRAKQILGGGISILIFPEGTRSHTGVLGRFQSGGFRLAVQTGIPIIPVVITGTRQLLPRGTWAFRWGARVRIRVLPAVVPPQSRRDLRVLMGQVRVKMREAYREGLRSC